MDAIGGSEGDMQYYYQLKQEAREGNIANRKVLAALNNPSENRDSEMSDLDTPLKDIQPNATDEKAVKINDKIDETESSHKRAKH